MTGFTHHTAPTVPVPIKYTVQYVDAVAEAVDGLDQWWTDQSSDAIGVTEEPLQQFYQQHCFETRHALELF